MWWGEGAPGHKRHNSKQFSATGWINSSFGDDITLLGFPGGSEVNNPSEIWETWVRSLSWEDPLEEGMATHSSIPAWRIPWTEEPGGLQSMELQRVRHNWVCTYHCIIIITFLDVLWTTDLPCEVRVNIGSLEWFSLKSLLSNASCHVPVEVSESWLDPSPNFHWCWTLSIH